MAEDTSTSSPQVPPDGACVDCAKGFVWTGEPRGKETTLSSLSVYESFPKVSNPGNTAAILFVHDAFGWRFPNNRLVCDALSETTGVPVYMPDFYSGETILTEEQAAVLIDPKPSVFGKIGQGLQMVVAFPRFLMHILKFNVARTQPLLDQAVKEIKAQHGGEGCQLGAVGYCWGGKHSLRLGAQGQLAACVTVHPSLVSPSEDKLQDLSAPTLFVCAEKDDLFTENLWTQTLAAVNSSHTPPVIDRVVYPGTTHGFAIRCSEGDSVAMAARDEALRRTAQWFLQHLLGKSAQ